MEAAGPRESPRSRGRREERRGGVAGGSRGRVFSDVPRGEVGQECAGAEGASGSQRRSRGEGPERRTLSPAGTGTCTGTRTHSLQLQLQLQVPLPVPRTLAMAEPLLRKTFAKLRARRRKSLKGGRSEGKREGEGGRE